MAEDESNKQEEKFEFTPEGEAIGYISLDQARVLALQHARDNRDFYGRFGDMGLIWDVIGADETEDYYEVRLSYWPAGNFRSPGIEQFKIDKTGPIESRQIVSPPQTSRRAAYLLGAAAVLVAAVALAIGLFSTGELKFGNDSGSQPVSVGITPDAPAAIVSPIATPTPTSTSAPDQTPDPGVRGTGPRFVGIIVPTPLPPGTPLPQDWRLETAVRPEGSGSIEMSPPQQDQLYFQGDSVELTANCNSGFVRWEGDVPVSLEKTENPISVTMDKPLVLYAFCAEPAEAAYSAGAELNDAGEYEEAIEKLSEAIRLDPAYVPAYSLRGSAYLRTGQNQAAIRDYDEAIRLAPESPDQADDYYNRGFVYQTLGEYRQAIEDFTQAIRLNPVRANLYESRAAVHDQLGEEQQASADRDIACQVDKTYCKIVQAPAP